MNESCTAVKMAAGIGLATFSYNVIFKTQPQRNDCTTQFIRELSSPTELWICLAKKLRARLGALSDSHSRYSILAEDEGLLREKCIVVPLLCQQKTSENFVAYGSKPS